jgi:hypothetical protein
VREAVAVLVRVKVDEAVEVLVGDEVNVGVGE